MENIYGMLIKNWNTKFEIILKYVYTVITMEEK